MQTFNGRNVIKTSVKEVTPDNVVDVVKAASLAHDINRYECSYLYQYYRGRQSILTREKQVRPEINNTVVQNHAYEIVNFKTDYLYGDPVKYVRKSDDEGARDGVTDSISKLNILMATENKVVVDREIGLWQHICGTGFRWVFPDAQISDGFDPDEAPFEIASLSPINTFVVYTDDIVPKCVLGCFVIDSTGYENFETTSLNLPNEKRSIKYAVYTKDRYYEIENEKILNRDKDGSLGVRHYLGAVPIIEYPANPARLGAFEVVLSQLDAINLMQSNRLDGVEQLVQSYLVFKNCEINDEALKAMRDLGAIQIASLDGQKEADVNLLSVELSQDQVQVLVDDLYLSALAICGMPDREGGSRSTGDTQQAVLLRDGWQAAESCAKGSEVMFERSEKEFLKIVFKILQVSGEIKDLKMSDIKVQFTRNRTDNVITKTQGMLNQLAAGINPRVVISNCGLYSDPEQVYVDSIDYLEKWKEADSRQEGGEPPLDNRLLRENSPNANEAEKPTKTQGEQK